MVQSAFGQPLLASEDFEVDWDHPLKTSAVCRIHKGTWLKEKGGTVCIKEFKTEGLPQEEIGRLVQAERDAQAVVVHDNICRTHGWIAEPLSLVMEWLEGTFHEAIFPLRRKPVTMTEHERLIVLTDLARGLAALHNAQVLALARTVSWLTTVAVCRSPTLTSSRRTSC
jgi:hypothetical protein